MFFWLLKNRFICASAVWAALLFAVPFFAHADSPAPQKKPEVIVSDAPPDINDYREDTEDTEDTEEPGELEDTEAEDESRKGVLEFLGLDNLGLDKLFSNDDDVPEDRAESIEDTEDASAVQEESHTDVPIPAHKPEVILPTSRPVPEYIESLETRYKKKDFSPTLSSDDRKLYQEIFALQKDGQMNEAEEKIKSLSNPLLLGHVLFQRYMHPSAYSSSYEELKSWMEAFADHPGADNIYALAQKRCLGSSNDLRAPIAAKGFARVREPTMRPGKAYLSSRTRSPGQISALNSLKRQIIALIRKSENESALGLLSSNDSKALLDNVEYDLLKSEIAAGFLYSGDMKRAYTLASEAAARSGLHVPKAGWVMGLVSWQYKNYARAAQSFEIAARSPYASGWLLSAGAYWAARAHMRTGNVKVVTSWLKRGAKYPRTFYGLISTRALGQNFDFNWSNPPFTAENMRILSSISGGARAIALEKTGQKALAKAELARLKPSGAAERTALLAFVTYINLPALSMRIGAVLSDPSGRSYDGALYPVVPWEPRGGYAAEPALMHAIMRQESRFNPNAESPSGAQGLMQLMPSTAHYIAGGAAGALNDPPVNLALGQAYLKHLLELEPVHGELLSLIIAYNAGPGNLSKWKKRWAQVSDPLLFIELLPSFETRAYVERVLANYWIYRLREGKNVPTLEALAAGKRARYVPTGY
ncbi:MAG: lytic transglycosylase domain-containing protein [Alphaproteobacteria bacterium]|nr:lytic transglycosylase domain-containing protein [Alphaproteobacteria bacterium]